MVTEQQRGSVKRCCEQCGSEFSVFLSTLAAGKGRCCSKTCATAFRVGKKMTTPRKTRSDKKPRKSYVCKQCGKEFVEDRPRCNPRYCSNKCSGISKTKNRKHHTRHKHAADLINWARRVILRDKKCVTCGVRENLQSHHVNHYSIHPELRFDVENGIALCPPCHHSQHPEHKLELYLSRGGQSIKRCVVCEGEYLPRKKPQRTCSISCGQKLRRAVKQGDEKCLNN